jgi:hypothetical protein
MSTETFYTALQARELSTSRREVYDEIKLIETGVMDAVENETLLATIGPASDTPIVTGFTNSSTHYLAWSDSTVNDTDAHRVARKQMDDVISNFAKLGYVITRERHLSTSTFNWIVRW